MKNIKKEAKKLGLCISAFIRQAIIEKVENGDRLNKVEEKIKLLKIKMNEEKENIKQLLQANQNYKIYVKTIQLYPVSINKVFYYWEYN